MYLYQLVRPSWGKKTSKAMNKETNFHFINLVRILC
jgi:hypothetical protein